MAKSKLQSALASQQYSASKAAAKKRAQAAEEAKKASVRANLSGKKKGLKRAKNAVASAGAATGAGAAPKADVTNLAAHTSDAKDQINDERIGNEGKANLEGKGKPIVADTTTAPTAPASIANPVKATIPFDKLDTILLLGEGNFSYSLSLLKAPHNIPAHQILATAYDSEKVTYEKYPDAESHVQFIRSNGGRVEFGVDARALEKCKPIGKKRKWSRIVFNFPHVGAGITDQDRNILSNQHMLLRFFRSAEPLLTEGPARYTPPSRSSSSSKGKGVVKMRGKANNKVNMKKRSRKDSDDELEDGDADGADEVEHELGDEDGQVAYLLDESDPSFGSGLPSSSLPGFRQRHEFTPPSNRQGSILLTLLTCPPYTLWSVPQLASKPPYLCPGTHHVQPKYDLVRSFEFVPSAYEGYEHRRTIGWKEGVSKGHNEEIVGRKGKARTWEFARRDEVDED